MAAERSKPHHDYSISVFNPAMANSVAKLQRLHWASPFRLNRAYVDWKYLNNPYTDEPLIYVALLGDEVVGMRGMFGAAWSVDDAPPTVIPCAADTLIHPDHRDRGLFEGMSAFAQTDLVARGYTYVLNLSPTAANFAASVISMGWRSIGSSKELVRTTDAAAARRSVTARLPRTARVRAAARMGRRLRARVRSSAFTQLDGAANSTEIEISATPRPVAMAALAAWAASPNRVRHVRDEAFFEWRFDNPRAEYRFLFAGNAELDGYMVLHNSRGRAAVNIADLQATSHAVSASLLSCAVQLGGFPTIHVWARSLDDGTIALLEEQGFEHGVSPAGTTRMAGKAMVKALHNPDRADSWVLHDLDLSSASSWDLQMVSSDAF